MTCATDAATMSHGRRGAQDFPFVAGMLLVYVTYSVVSSLGKGGLNAGLA